MDSQRIRDIKQSPSRSIRPGKPSSPLAAKMNGFYMVTGQHDMIAVVEASDDAALAKALLTAAAQGNVTTVTCRAYTEDEYRRIITGLV